MLPLYNLDDHRLHISAIGDHIDQRRAPLQQPAIKLTFAYLRLSVLEKKLESLGNWS